MNLNLSQLTAYQADEQRAKATLDKAKRDLAYAKLQAKQTKQLAARAKRDQDIRDLIALYPKDQLEVMPAPGTIWCSIHLSGIAKSLYLDVPATCGFEEYRLETPNDLQSHHYYRKAGSPVVLIVTHHHV